MARRPTSFHMPGHKHAPVGSTMLEDLWGEGVFRSDFSEMGGVDYLHAPVGPLREAQQLAAELFGADNTYFLINGSTAGNQAGILATVREGQHILLPRSSHRSVYAALVLSGAVPNYVPPTIHAVAMAPLASDLHRAAALAQAHAGQPGGPTLAAIHLTSPTYYGTCSDVAGFAALAHDLGVPLLVDEAHGAHFTFDATLPRPALDCGADLSVQSVHKTLGSLTQSSLLHVRGSRIAQRDLRAALSALQSSSPSALLLASLDGVRAVMGERGVAMIGKAVRLSTWARGAIQDIDGLWCYGDDLLESGQVHAYDATKLLVRVGDIGLTGYEAARRLETSWQVEPELRDPQHVLFTVTFADTEESVSRLVTALRWLAETKEGETPRSQINTVVLPEMPPMAMTPREAYFSDCVTVPLSEARGRISAETIIPYPPGIPVIMPGEVLEPGSIEYLIELAGKGATFVGVEDPYLSTVRVTT